MYIPHRRKPETVEECLSYWYLDEIQEYLWVTWKYEIQTLLKGVISQCFCLYHNVSWQDHMRNVELYGNLPKLTDKIRQRQMRLAGHCVRHPELAACELILWDPAHGKRSRGRGRTTMLDTLKRDTGLSNTEELRAIMENREAWRLAIKSSRIGVTWHSLVHVHVLLLFWVNFSLKSLLSGFT